MSSENDAAYRLRLAKGFRQEAEQDLKLQRWRSCVDNAQLSVENAGKAIIALFEPVERTHNPAIKLRQLAQANRVASALRDELNAALSVFDQHGDAENYRDPWSLFTEEDAQKAVAIMQQCLTVAERFYGFYCPAPPAVE